MKINKENLKGFIIPKIKFAGTSVVATIIDYVLVFILLDVLQFRNEGSLFGIDLVLANTIGTFCGMLANFILQKKYVFSSKRRTWVIFLMTVGFSFLGFIINQFLFDVIREHLAFFSEHTFLTKIIVTGIMFFFNFTTKQFSFEKKIRL